MKQITILLSSVLTLLLITSSNASAAAYIKFDGIQAQQPNMNSGGRFMPKRNRLGDDISGYGYRNILKKGNVFKGNVRMLPNRNSGERFNPISKYSISDEPAFMPKPTKMHDSIHCVSNSARQIDGKDFVCKNNKWLGPLGGDGVFSRGVNERSGVIIGDNHFRKEQVGFRESTGNILWNTAPSGSLGGQEGEAFNPTSKYSISDEPAFIPKPDSAGKAALGPDVVTTLEHGPGISNQTKGVQLKFINGEWR